MYTMSSRRKAAFTIILTGWIFFAATNVSAIRRSESESNVIQVFDVEELYGAVNDPLNAGARLILFPGTYALTRFDGNGQLRPNGGRLELQTDMSLVGFEGDRSAVVIEAIGLPVASLTGGSVPFAAIRVGRGRNSIEWLTVRNGRGGQGNMITSLNDGNPFYFRLAHAASTGSGNNLSIANFGPAAAGRTIEVDLVDNDLFEGFGGGFRQGFRIANLSGANGSIINVRLNGNRVWGNGFNLIINNGTVGSHINVFSAGNYYFDNGAGLVVVGGINGAIGNTVNYEGHGDRFMSNDDEQEVDKGGLLLFGGDRPFVTSTVGASNNTVTAKLFGCRMAGNADVDLLAIGGRSIVPDLISTVFENQVILELNGMSRDKTGVEFFAGSVPNDPASNNSVTVNR